MKLTLDQTRSVGNSVRLQTPWYCADEDTQQRKMAEAPEHLQPHLRSFCEDGYVAIENSVTPEMCDTAREAFDAFVERNAYRIKQFANAQGYYPRMINMHLAIPELLECYARNTALELFGYLFGARPNLYTSLYFQRGSTQPIHRDTPFFSTAPQYFYLGFWVALEEANEQNGGLRVVPGGHKLPEEALAEIGRSKYSDLDQVPDADMDLWNSYQDHMMNTVGKAGLKPELLSVKKATTVIWHRHLPHGGSPIKDQTRTRNSLVVHTTPSGVPVYHHQAFFNPEKRAPQEIDWRYWRFEDHDVMYHEAIDIEHKLQIPIAELN